MDRISSKEKKFQHRFFGRSRAANSVVRDLIWPNFELIQALMYVIVPANMKNDLINNS